MFWGEMVVYYLVLWFGVWEDLNNVFAPFNFFSDTQTQQQFIGTNRHRVNAYGPVDPQNSKHLLGVLITCLIIATNETSTLNAPLFIANLVSPQFIRFILVLTNLEAIQNVFPSTIQSGIQCLLSFKKHSPYQ